MRKQALAEPGQPELDEIAERIRTRFKRALDDVIETGRDLIAAKKIAGHGNWLTWLEREFGWTSDKTAERFMSVAELADKFDNLTTDASPDGCSNGANTYYVFIDNPAGASPSANFFAQGTSPRGLWEADSVTITAGPITVLPVPEPSTWAMMLQGFAGLGFAGYRRTRKPVSIGV